MRSIWISLGAIEVAGDRKARVQIFVQLEGKQAWALGKVIMLMNLFF
jgi:hypothetical protein